MKHYTAEGIADAWNKGGWENVPFGNQEWLALEDVKAEIKKLMEDEEIMSKELALETLEQSLCMEAIP